MKKTIFSLFTFMVLCSLQSCLKDQDNHQLQIVYPNGCSLLYADDTMDSICFYTFDSWKVTPEKNWLTMASEDNYHVNYDKDTRYLNTCYLNVEPNTTGKARIATVAVDSYEYTCWGIFYQFSFLNISHPKYSTKSYFDNSNYSLPDTVVFVLVDSAYVTTDSIAFDVKKNWTLEIPQEDASWIQASETSGRAGHNCVKLTLQENQSTENRKTTMTLKSSGVSNNIILHHFGKPKKNN